MNKVSVTVEMEEQSEESHSRHMDSTYYNDGEDWCEKMGISLCLSLEAIANSMTIEVLANAITDAAIDAEDELEVKLHKAAMNLLKKRKQERQSDEV